MWGVRNTIATILDLIFGVMTFFLGLRFIMELFGANSATPFGSWIYSISGNLMSPFAGIVPNLTIGAGFIDMVALIAIFAYGVLFYLVTALVNAVTRPRVAHDHDHLV